MATGQEHGVRSVMQSAYDGPAFRAMHNRSMSNRLIWLPQGLCFGHCSMNNKSI